MNLRTLLLLLVTALYFFGAHWLYINKINGICCGNEGTNGSNTTAVVPPKGDTDEFSNNANAEKPLVFNWSEADAVKQEGFEDFKSGMLTGMTDDNTLELTGNYYANEPTPEGFPTMGHARAASLRQLLKNDISEDRVIINGKLVSEEKDIRTKPFEAISYNWVDAVKKDETTIIEIENRILVFHPYNSSNRLEDEKINAYLTLLAERLSNTNERVTITGHTDYRGDAASNRKLGLYRAQGVRDILVQKGVDKRKITVITRGERYPIATNRTSAGRQKNRRTVLELEKLIAK